MSSLLDTLISVPSPVIVATGTGQVGEGLQSTWGLEDDDDEEEEMSDLTEREKKKGTVSVIRYICYKLIKLAE